MSLWRTLLVLSLAHSYCSESCASAVSQKGMSAFVRAKPVGLKSLVVAQRPFEVFPSLLDVTIEQLENGLAKRRFSSVDLVKVSLTHHNPNYRGGSHLVHRVRRKEMRFDVSTTKLHNGECNSNIEECYRHITLELKKSTNY
jgi:hypothetical protein